jgi:hypothetical protein
LIDEKVSWPADRVDKVARKTKALDEFKALIKEKPVSFWTSAEDLHGKFSIALMKAFTARPREGWVRASTVAGPEVTAESTRLSTENANLRGSLEEARKKAAQDRQEEVRRVIDKMLDIKRGVSYRYTMYDSWQTARTTLFDAFLSVGSGLMVESSIEEMANSLAMDLREDNDKPWDIAAHNQVQSLMADFLTLELVEPSTRKHPVSDKNEYWSLSPFGLQALKEIRTALLDPGSTDRVKDDSSEEAPPSSNEEDPTPDVADT